MQIKALCACSQKGSRVWCQCQLQQSSKDACEGRSALCDSANEMVNVFKSVVHML